jgi:hypothetical protein
VDIKQAAIDNPLQQGLKQIDIAWKGLWGIQSRNRQSTTTRIETMIRRDAKKF